MLTALAADETYIIERVPQSKGGQDYARCFHDSIAAALIFWRDADAVSRNRPLPDFESPLDTCHPDCLPVRPEKPTVFETINDLIWDHQIFLFAQSKGFSQRLGLRFVQKPEFDLTTQRGRIDYERFISRPSGYPYRLLVMPGSLLPKIQEQPWVQIGIPKVLSRIRHYRSTSKGFEPASRSRF